MVSKLIVLIVVVLGLLFASAPAVHAALNQSIIVNHQAVGQFSQLSDTDLAKASTLKMLFRHASVGGNIKSGLTQLYNQNSKYNASNWTFQSRGNPGWQPKVDDLVTQVEAQLSSYAIFSMKFCYVDPGADWTYYRTKMEQLQADYPTKIFIWWTMPILTNDENQNQTRRNQFNENVRSYAQTHPIILFDIAAIESHDPNGNVTAHNGMEAMYSSYSSDGGHLSTTGSERVAKAFWYMMVRIAQFQSGNPSSTPVTLMKPGDANNDNRVDGVDYIVWLNHYNQSVSGATNGDFNNSNRVDGVDYIVWMNNYGK